MKTKDGKNLFCEVEEKVCYTEREAGAIINDCRRHGSPWGVDHKNRPTRKYWCKSCRSWHLTHLRSYKPLHNYKREQLSA